MVKYITWCLKQTFLLTSRLNVSKQTTSKANNFTTQCRCIVTQRATQTNIDYDEPKDYLEFASEQKHGRFQAVNILRKMLSVATENAKKAVNDYPIFMSLTKETLHNNFQTLREAGFYKSTIKDNKYLLTGDTVTLKTKINIVKKLCTDINDVAPLFHLQPKELMYLEYKLKGDSKYLPARNRLYYLANRLQCDIATICELMIYNTSLIRLCAPKLLSVTEYILESGISPQNILNDVRVFSYRVDTIKSNIERAKMAGVDPIKPWVMRCQEKTWKKLEQRKAKRALILKPGQSVPECLREILHCDIESVNFLVAKNPKLLTMNIEKLTTMMKFLYNEGYKIEDIMRSPVTGRKFTVVQERYNTWKKASNRLPPLFALVQTQDMFEKLLQVERERHNQIVATREKEKLS